MFSMLEFCDAISRRKTELTSAFVPNKKGKKNHTVHVAKAVCIRVNCFYSDRLLHLRSPHSSISGNIMCVHEIILLMRNQGCFFSQQMWTHLNYFDFIFISERINSDMLGHFYSQIINSISQLDTDGFVVHKLLLASRWYLSATNKLLCLCVNTISFFSILAREALWFIESLSDCTYSSLSLYWLFHIEYTAFERGPCQPSANMNESIKNLLWWEGSAILKME